MFRVARTAVLLALCAAPALAQEPGAMGGPRRFGPPPDHWMTIDSLVQAVGLTPEQKTKVTQPYTALNAVMHDVAARRMALRQQMQGSNFVPGQEPTPEMRARMDSVRTEMEGFQAEADQWLAAIRNLLTPAQQTKFDGLPKPQFIRRPPRATGPGML
jgi:LTXXQ motif family protein